jgi:hypothetical protein
MQRSIDVKIFVPMVMAHIVGLRNHPHTYLTLFSCECPFNQGFNIGVGFQMSKDSDTGVSVG